MTPKVVVRDAALARVIANKCRVCVGVSKTKNPTLVHHGVAQRARFHILGPSGQPAVDSYMGPAETTKLAHVLADFWGAPVRVIDNDADRGPDVFRQPYRKVSRFGQSRLEHPNPTARETSKLIESLLERARELWDAGQKKAAQELYDRAWSMAPEPTPSRRKANPKGRKTAEDFYAELGHNVDLYYSGKLGYESFSERNRDTWDSISMAGPRMKSAVLKLWRDRNQSRPGKGWPNPKAGAGTMTLTAHEAKEFSRAAQALYARGATAPAHLLSAVAASKTVPLSQYDRAAEVYRAWLVFDAPKGNPSRSKRARYQRSARRQAPRGIPGAGSRRAARALAAGRGAKAHHHMLQSLERGRFRNPKGRNWTVFDANGVPFWSGKASDRDEASMMAERSVAGRSDPPEPWIVEAGKAKRNPKGRNWLRDLASYHYNDEAAYWRAVEDFPAVGSLRTEMMAAATKAWALEHKGRRNPKGRVSTAKARSAIAGVLAAGGFAALATEVRKGADPIKAIDTAMPFAGHNRAKLQRLRELTMMLKLSGTIPNPKGRYSIREVQDHAGGTSNRIVTVFEVYDNTDGHVVMRTYNRRDATTERAYRNKFENPRAALEAGERVSIPYTGRSKKRTHDKATVLGLVDGGVLVQVKRGKSTLQQTWPEDAVKRLPARGGRAAAARVGKVKAKLELKSVRARLREAKAAAVALRKDYDCTEAQAKAAQPYSGEAPSAHYRGLVSRLGRLRNEIAAEDLIAAELEQADPRTADPWANPAPAIAVGDKWVENLRPANKVTIKSIMGKRLTYAGSDGNRVFADIEQFENTFHPAARMNPRSDMDKAVRIAAMWQDRDDFKPTVRQVKKPAALPSVGVELGQLVSVDYQSDKYTGREAVYTHRFKRPRPLLVSDPDAKLHIVGGRVKITADGLVN